MNVVKVPAPEPRTDYEKANIATEYAFNALIAEAIKLGLALNPVTGLMYLPSQKITRQFQLACRAVFDSLAVATPKESHGKTPCGECGGTGEIVNDGPYSVCGDCGGTGVEGIAAAS